MTPTSGQAWTVHPMPQAMDQLRDLHQVALARRVVYDLHAAIAYAQHKMITDPEGWGDPLYRYVNLGLLVHRGPTPIILVESMVDAAHRLVYVRSVQPSPGSPLTQ